MTFRRHHVTIIKCKLYSALGYAIQRELRVGKYIRTNEEHFRLG